MSIRKTDRRIKPRSLVCRLRAALKSCGDPLIKQWLERLLASQEQAAPPQQPQTAGVER